MAFDLGVRFVSQTCCFDNCRLTFAMTVAFDNAMRASHEGWYCPRGHRQFYNGKTDAEKLRAAEAREVHLTDQLRAAIRDAETSRVKLLRDRSRIAAGVCPCCPRSFTNLRRHIRGEHPDYDVTRVDGKRAPMYHCECGQAFETFAGLRTHQGKSRADEWDLPGKSRWSSHLTVVGS